MNLHHIVRYILQTEYSWRPPHKVFRWPPFNIIRETKSCNLDVPIERPRQTDICFVHCTSNCRMLLEIQRRCSEFHTAKSQSKHDVK